MGDKNCKPFQSGYCKFGERCRKLHINVICENLQCDKVSCENRHPKSCRYFSTFNTCKFGVHCAFFHNKSETIMKIEKTKKEITVLKSEIEHLQSSIVQSENQVLRDEIEELKSTISCNAKHIKVLYEKITEISQKICEASNVCELCEYQASSSTVLKAHITRKHKYDQKGSEQLGDTSFDISLEVSHLLCTINEYSSQNPEYNVNNSEIEIESEFKCKYCDSIFGEGNTLEEHMIKKHKLPENCSSCYGCDEKINSNLAIGQYVVLWDRGIVGGDAGVHKVRYLVPNSTGKYWLFYLRPDNTGHNISDRKILAILSQTGKYQASVCIKLALDIIISEIYFVKKGVSDVKFKLTCILIIKD